MPVYNRRAIVPLQDAWITKQDTGEIVGVEIANSQFQKSYFPGIETNTDEDATFVTLTSTTSAITTANITTSNVTTLNVDNVFGMSASYSEIPVGRSVNVPAATQLASFASVTVSGTLTVSGEHRVCAWPA